MKLKALTAAHTSVTKSKSKHEGAGVMQSAVKAGPSAKKLEASASTGNISSASQDVRARPLPEFCHRTWSTRFLPTIYHCLGAANEPWELGDGESGIVTAIQGAVNYGYPDVKYIVRRTDKIVTMVTAIISL